MNNEAIEKAVHEIATNHRKIIDDWCKAYLAELYEKNGSIKPGDFVLVEQQPTIHPFGNGILVRKYWFEPKEKDCGTKDIPATPNDELQH